MLVLIAYVGLQKAYPSVLNKQGVSDFEVFHLAGKLIWSGEINQAFDKSFFSELQADIPGSLVTASRSSTMLWSYPPVYNFVVAPMGLVPVWLGYTLFMLLSLGLFTWTLKELSDEYFDTALVLALPTIFLVIKNGQNSFLTAALIGLTCLYLIRGKLTASIPLGLMIIKPHLALGLGLITLSFGYWRTAILSISVALATIALSATVFGTESWTAFLDGLGTTGDALQSGQFPLHRQSSAYIFGLYWGLGNDLSLLIHALIAASVLGLLVHLRRKNVPFEILLGYGVYFSALVSPYTYDYDLLMMSMGAALMLPAIERSAHQWEKWFLFACAWIIGGYGLLMGLIYNPLKHATENVIYDFPALIAVFYVLAGVILYRVLIRKSQRAPTAFTAESAV